MAGPVARRSIRHRYSGTVAASLRLAVALALALNAGGCAVSGVGSLFSRGDRDAMASASEDVTGSVGPARLANTGGLPSDTDLVFTKLAIVEVLQRGSKESSAPWENPSSGARGTVTPIASAYEREGSTCRDFLASYVRRHGPETWMQGEACRGGKGQWEVKSLRPWTRS
jgi:surface antigen